MHTIFYYKFILLKFASKQIFHTKLFQINILENKIYKNFIVDIL